MLKPKPKKGVFMSKKDLVNEHVKLVNILRHPTSDKLAAEAKDQGAELKKYKRL